MVDNADFSEKQDTCDLCGSLFPAQILQHNGTTGLFLCQDCLAEEENCGCADE